MTHPTTTAIEHARYHADHNDLAGKFPAHSTLGGYPLRYMMQDGGDLCGACVNGENGSEVGSDDAVYEDGTVDPQWTVVSVGPYYEGPVVQCDHCNADIASAYGDPDAFEVKLTNVDDDTGSVLVVCSDQRVKEEQQSIAGSNWEAPGDMDIAYAIVCDAPDLVASLEAEGYNVDQSEYCSPE